jgi:cell division GTPase FtsZ
MGALTVAVVTKPFSFEGKRRMAQAERGIAELMDSVDTTIVIPNEKLLAVAEDAGFFESFESRMTFCARACREFPTSSPSPASSIATLPT